MALSSRGPLPDQENMGESKGKIHKSSNAGGGQSDRIVLHPLQPHSSGKKLTHSHVVVEKPTLMRNTKVNKKVSTTGTKRHMKSQAIQTEMSGSLDLAMCTSEEPPLEYWKVLAEQRRQALAETLQENEELHSENKLLRDKINELEKRLENEDYFAMMYKIACSDRTKDLQ